MGPVARGAKYFGWAVSAPLVAAAAPVAALAWATPWVDLPMAVDIASAPAVGLGLASEALAGFPLYAAWPQAKDAVGDAKKKPLIPWGFVVEHRAPRSTSRAAEAVPPEIEAYYAVEDGEVARLRGEVSSALRAAPSPVAPVKVPWREGAPSALELYPARGAKAGARRALVLMTPPSQANFAARYLARYFARRGIHAAVIAPERPFLEPDLAPAEIEDKFRRAVVNARTALRALAALDCVDRSRLDYVGVSAGGIFGAVLLALEPSIRRAALILPGGDLPRILRESDESTVKAYREAWAKRGVGRDALVQDLARSLRTDPARLARHVDPRRVLMFLGARDTRVPTETGLDLWRALGEPELYLLSGNHETASLCFGFILRRSVRFLREGR